MVIIIPLSGYYQKHCFVHGSIFKNTTIILIENWQRVNPMIISESLENYIKNTSQTWKFHQQF